MKTAEDYFWDNLPENNIIPETESIDRQRFNFDDIYPIMESYAEQIRVDAFSEGYGQGLEHATIEEQAKAKEHAIEFLVDLAEHYVQNTHSREKAESYYNYWTTNKPQP